MWTEDFKWLDAWSATYLRGFHHFGTEEHRRMPKFPLLVMLCRITI